MNLGARKEIAHARLMASRPFDAAEYLGDAESREAYLKSAFETGDPDHIAEAVGTVARAAGAGSSNPAQETGAVGDS